MRKITYDTLPEAISELLERLERIEKHLSGKSIVSKQKKIAVQINPDDTITVKEAQRLLNISLPSLYYYIKSRKIPVIAKKGKELYFSRSVFIKAISKKRKRSKRQTKKS